MNRHRILYTLGLVFALLCSCTDYDTWTSDPRAHLTFGNDTISFDTILSTVSSSTQRLLVYNNNKEGLRINEVRLKKASASPFRVNVDGEFLQGGTGYDFEVRGNDSIFVLLEATQIGRAHV